MNELAHINRTMQSYFPVDLFEIYIFETERVPIWN